MSKRWKACYKVWWIDMMLVWPARPNFPFGGREVPILHHGDKSRLEVGSSGPDKHNPGCHCWLSLHMYINHLQIKWWPCAKSDWDLPNYKLQNSVCAVGKQTCSHRCTKYYHSKMLLFYWWNNRGGCHISYHLYLRRFNSLSFINLYRWPYLGVYFNFPIHSSDNKVTTASCSAYIVNPIMQHQFHFTQQPNPHWITVYRQDITAVTAVLYGLWPSQPS